MTTHDDPATLREFHAVVNMTQAALHHWLDSDDSKSVGMTPDGQRVTDPHEPESVGHHMGHEILAVRGKKTAELTEHDYAAMRKVIGYVHRHGKQRPAGDVTDTRWRKSMMNWGHDPLKV